ncbi:hypothetical protein FHR81_000500 [Actinoalloteichus hoggarensis]|uniref:Uncharacterized protein n=1 Tax=Actinoalloteichus hoggarensis TaxID=1470176 RepID=A0A221W2H9_9PSEU|nr:DUF3097 domain-containing protein [Actinoalloteichus hoggarensis]ASO19821.1 hypothetical protein AHOG_10890 [Actinoalloteichus hoggarensis]MBB5919471.1 hypothetical protein [Actinoalloteichus hoggarensis]
MTSRYGNADYGSDVLRGAAARAAPVPTVPATVDLVVEDVGGFCGAVVHCDRVGVTLEDRHGVRRVFPLRAAGFLLEGRPVTLTVPSRTPPSSGTRSASGSVRVEGLRARTARASRIWVEGVHDAELLERVWGHDLRVEGIVVEPLQGVDDLAEALADFGPRPHRRVGVLVDHLVPGSKESRLVAAIDSPHVLVTGHPYVDVWEAVRPSALGIDAWPSIPRGTEWKKGVCAALGWGEPTAGWQRVLAGVRGYRDLETPLIGAVERLIDFVTVPGSD